MGHPSGRPAVAGGRSLGAARVCRADSSAVTSDGGAGAPAGGDAVGPAGSVPGCVAPAESVGEDPGVAEPASVSSGGGIADPDADDAPDAGPAELRGASVPLSPVHPAVPIRAIARAQPAKPCRTRFVRLDPTSPTLAQPAPVRPGHHLRSPARSRGANGTDHTDTECHCSGTEYQAGYVHRSSAPRTARSPMIPTQR